MQYSKGWEPRFFLNKKSFCRAVCLLRDIGSSQSEEVIWTISNHQMCIATEIPKTSTENSPLLCTYLYNKKTNSPLDELELQLGIQVPTDFHTIPIFSSFFLTKNKITPRKHS